MGVEDYAGARGLKASLTARWLRLLSAAATSLLRRLAGDLNLYDGRTCSLGCARDGG
jgi:hypothetical protein